MEHASAICNRWGKASGEEVAEGRRRRRRNPTVARATGQGEEQERGSGHGGKMDGGARATSRARRVWEEGRVIGGKGA
jgi:hypothetical protein